MEKRKKFVDAFVEGGRQGVKIGLTSMIPNIVFAFAIIAFLNRSGLTDIIGNIFQPIMVLVGLPGVAATAIMACYLSTGGGIGVAASLAASGYLDASQVIIVLVGIMISGSLVQYMGRVLATAGVDSKHYPALIGINIFTGFLGMFVTQFLV